MATAVLHFPYLFLSHALETHQLKEPVNEKRGNDGHEQIISGVTKKRDNFESRHKKLA